MEFSRKSLIDERSSPWYSRISLGYKTVGEGVDGDAVGVGDDEDDGKGVCENEEEGLGENEGDEVGVGEGEGEGWGFPGMVCQKMPVTIKTKNNNALVIMSNRLCCFTFSTFFTSTLQLRVSKDVEAF